MTLPLGESKKDIDRNQARRKLKPGLSHLLCLQRQVQFDYYDVKGSVKTFQKFLREDPLADGANSPIPLK